MLAVAEPLLLAPVAGPVIPGLPSVAGLVRAFEEFEFWPASGVAFDRVCNRSGETRETACAIGMLAVLKGFVPWTRGGSSVAVLFRVAAWLTQAYPTLDARAVSQIAHGFDNPHASYLEEVTYRYGQAVARATYAKRVPGE